MTRCFCGFCEMGDGNFLLVVFFLRWGFGEEEEVWDWDWTCERFWGLDSGGFFFEGFEEGCGEGIKGGKDFEL